MKHVFVVASMVVAVVATETSSRAQSASSASGLAFDSILDAKFAREAAPLPPDVPFDQAFRDASRATPAPSSTPAASAAVSPLPGFSLDNVLNRHAVERHFVLGALERTDDVLANTSTIVDCTARTKTTLDRAKRTYRIVSLAPPPVEPASPASTGQPSAAPSATPAAASASPAATPPPLFGFLQNFALPPGAGVALSLETTSRRLDARTIEGVSAEGYQAQVRASLGVAPIALIAGSGNFTLYFSDRSAASAEGRCAQSVRAVAPAVTPGQSVVSAFGSDNMALPHLSPSVLGDTHFLLRFDGPIPPVDRLALSVRGQFAITPPATVPFLPAGTVTLTINRGHLRSLRASDTSLFKVPPGYTQQ